MTFESEKKYRFVAFGNSGDVGWFTFHKEGKEPIVTLSRPNLTERKHPAQVPAPVEQGFSTIQRYIQLGEQDGLFEIRPVAENKQPKDNSVTLQITYKPFAGERNINE